MSGILDSKTRIMDTIVTLEGRRQIANGKLQIEYVSFTDSTTFYDPDVINGSADVTTRLYFEQCHLPQDQITFEADDSGKLKPFKNNQGINAAYAGQILSSSASGSKLEYLSGSGFTSAAEALIASSLSNFKNLQALTTKDYVFDDGGFEIGPSNITFKRSKHSPVDTSYQIRSLSELDSLFNDKHLSREKNFKYLPPINKIENKTISRKDPAVITANKIGNYPDDHTIPEYSPLLLEKDLKLIENLGFLKKITFDPASLTNNIVAQMFEINSNEINKLDVIDYGSYQYLDSIKHAYFVGKVLIDDNGCQTFVKMFTLVFE